MQKIFYLIVLLGIFQYAAKAQCNLSYVGPANGDWHTAANWNLCKVPDANDIVTIPTGRSVNINNINATCRTITVQGTGFVTRNGTGTLTVTNSTGVVTCTAACNKRAFVTNCIYNGNMGGAAGADSRCQTQANNAGIGGTWRAWISTSTSNVNARLVNHTVPILRMDGAVIANNWTELTSINLQNAINRTAANVAPTGCPADFQRTWSNTSRTGNRNITANSCNEWTSNSNAVSGRTGVYGAITSIWSLATAAPIDGTCNGSLAIYCFEQ